RTRRGSGSTGRSSDSAGSTCRRCLTHPRWKRSSCPTRRRSRGHCATWRPSRLATTRVVMPQLGESVHEGTISKWLVKPGDRVVEFEPMLEVDTDKVSAEVPAPVTGVLKEILAKEGQTVQAGAEIAVVELGATAGEAADGRDGKVTATPEAPAPAPRVEAPKPAARAEAKPVAAPPPPPELEGGEHRYSPAVQMLASELKVDLSQIHGTGLGGRVTKKDVQEFAARAKAAPAAAPVTP